MVGAIDLIFLYKVIKTKQTLDLWCKCVFISVFVASNNQTWAISHCLVLAWSCCGFLMARMTWKLIIIIPCSILPKTANSGLTLFRTVNWLLACEGSTGLCSPSALFLFWLSADRFAVKCQTLAVIYPVLFRVVIGCHFSASFFSSP